LRLKYFRKSDKRFFKILLSRKRLKKAAIWAENKLLIEFFFLLLILLQEKFAWHSGAPNATLTSNKGIVSRDGTSTETNPRICYALVKSRVKNIWHNKQGGSAELLLNYTVQYISGLSWHSISWHYPLRQNPVRT
jgi:hypothetical protein